MLRKESGAARLQARPGTPTGAAPTGLRSLGAGPERDGLLYVPEGYRREEPAPLALLLHGAGGTAQHGLRPLRDLADEAGIILLAPDAQESTWDLLRGSYGPDIVVIDRLLERTFEQYAVDPARIAIGGFSDGASYALSVGITNGDLFSHVIALSPGFMVPAERRGSPRLFISHGTEDPVLPIENCSRYLVPQLERDGYVVQYREFAGGHTVPPEIAREAVDWFLAGPG